MHPDLRLFISQYPRVLCAALVSVIITAFLSIPRNLGNHPGQPYRTDVAGYRHMT